MTPEEFQTSLANIGWKKADFCRATDTHPTTVSRWMSVTSSIPVWVPNYLNLLADVQALHNKHLSIPTKQDKSIA